MKTVILDTFPLIKFFKNEVRSEKIQRILENIEKGESKGYISSITISELFYILARYKDVSFAKALINHIKLSRLEVVDVNERIAEIAGEFKYKYSGIKKKGLPIADAIIAATAFIKNAEIITEEEHFKKIKEIKLYSM